MSWWWVRSGQVAPPEKEELETLRSSSSKMTGFRLGLKFKVPRLWMVFEGAARSFLLT